MALLHNARELAAALGVDELLIQREDLNGIATGGGKARTMQNEIAAAANAGKTALVIPARAGSNAVLAASRLVERYGLKLYAILRPQPDSTEARENLALIADSCCNIIPVTMDVSLRRDAPFLSNFIRHLEHNGERVVATAFGASSIHASLAHFEAFSQIASHFSASDEIPVDRIYMPAASFDSGVGILAGLGFHRWHTELVLINVAQDDLPSIGSLIDRASNMATKLGLLPLPSGLFNISLRNLLSPGFGSMLEDAWHDVLALPSPVKLDQVYSGKAMRALQVDARSKQLGKVLFWYGNPAKAGEGLRPPSHLANALLYSS